MNRYMNLPGQTVDPRGTPYGQPNGNSPQGQPGQGAGPGPSGMQGSGYYGPQPQIPGVMPTNPWTTNGNPNNPRQYGMINPQGLGMMASMPVNKPLMQMDRIHGGGANPVNVQAMMNYDPSGVYAGHDYQSRVMQDSQAVRDQKGAALGNGGGGAALAGYQMGR